MNGFKFISTDKISRLPKNAGVYAFKKGREIFYIGKAGNIRERAREHREKFALNRGTRIGYVKTGSEITALILEAKLIKKYQPKFNIAWKDNKNYFFVAITREDFPRVFLTHQLKIVNCKLKIDFVWPFVEGRSLKRALDYLRKVFPYYTAKKHPPRSCLWCQLKLCPGPNPVKSAYQKNIKNLAAVLRGKSKKVLTDLKKEMAKFSRTQEFEKAAGVRDQIAALEKVMAHAKVLEQPPSDGENKLSSSPFAAARAAEAYDVSDLQGKEATGAMVTFIDGKPDKNFYRRFKIKIAGKPNDTAMIKETLSRRLKHTEWPLPDLILIDGGRAQLSAAINIKSQNPEAKKIRIMAIAKKKNELFMEGKKDPILLKKMPREIFNLILQLRDEAHRFAVAYHRKLRAKTLLEK